MAVERRRYFAYETPEDAPARHRIIAMRAARGERPQEIATALRCAASVIHRVLGDAVMQEYVARLQEEVEYRREILHEYLDRGRLAGLKYVVEVAAGQDEEGNEIEVKPAERLRAATALLDRHPDMLTAKGSRQTTEHRHRAVLDVDIRNEIEQLAADAQVRLAAIDVRCLPSIERVNDGTQESAGEEGDPGDEIEGGVPGAGDDGDAGGNPGGDDDGESDAGDDDGESDAEDDDGEICL